MSNKFNVRLSFVGEGDLTFQLPIIGEITIWAGRDIYIKGATTEIVEYLRQYRSMKLEHKLNGDSKGCYKVIEVDSIERVPYGLYRPVAVPKTESISTLKAQLVNNNDFIPEEAGQLTAEELKAKQEKQKQEELSKIPTMEDELKTMNENVNDEDDNKEPENIDTEDSSEDSKLPEDIANWVATCTKDKGKKLGELDEKAIRKIARYSNNDEEKEKANKALEILFPSA